MKMEKYSEWQDEVSVHYGDQMPFVFHHDTFTFCLLCMKSLCEVDPIGVRNVVVYHFDNSKHQHNYRTLFKKCFPDPTCERDEECLDIVNNSKCDLLSVLGAKSSYVCHHNGYILCLFCQQNVCRATGSLKKIKTYLTIHLQSEGHRNSFKENACFVYTFSKNDYFLMFHRSVVYCFLCKETLQQVENSLLQTAVAHLRKHQENEEIDKKMCGDVEETCRTLQDTDVGHLQRLQEKLKTEKDIHFYTNIHIKKNFEVNCPDPANVMCTQTDSSSFPEVKNLPNLSETGQSDFGCLEFNTAMLPTDLESYDLGRELRNRINECSESELLRIVGILPSCSDLSPEEVAYLKGLESQVPLMETNLKFISRKNNLYYCTLCDKGFPRKPIPSINKHFKSEKHNYLVEHEKKIKHQMHYEVLGKMSHKNFLKIGKLFRDGIYFNLAIELVKGNSLEMMCKFDPVIYNNKQYITKTGDNYLKCELCGVKYENLTDIKPLMYNINIHCKGSAHKKKRNDVLSASVVL